MLQVTKAKVRARREWWEASGTGRRRSWAVGTAVGSRCRKSGFAPVATVHQARKNAARLSCGMASRGASGYSSREGCLGCPRALVASRRSRGTMGCRCELAWVDGRLVHSGVVWGCGSWIAVARAEGKRNWISSLSLLAFGVDVEGGGLERECFPLKLSPEK